MSAVLSKPNPSLSIRSRLSIRSWLSIRSCIRAGGLLIGLAGLILTIAGSAAAQTLTIEETERLVRSVYYEGMPEEPATRIGPAGAARLVEMLANAEEASNHGQIMLALGLCGSPDAMAAIEAWLAVPRSGEVERNTFRAWQALPYALGHLARSDRRALRRLERLMHADAPNWTFRHHRGARLRRLARDSAVTSLSETGLPEARSMLDRAARNASDTQFEEHLRAARTRLMERAREVAP